MFIGSQQQFAPDALRQRLAGVLRGLDMSNGTPAEDVVATVLRIDHRLGGRERQAALELPDALFLNLAFEIVGAIEVAPARVELPSGTTLESKDPGEIEIGGEQWVLVAGQPGLHPVETAPRGANGPNLDLLHHHILRKTRKLACRRLGLPKPVLVCDTDARHLLHFDPLGEAGGVVLQHWAHGTGAPLFCAAFPWQIETFADAIVKDMRTLWKRRKDIACQVAEVRALAEARVEGHDAEVDAIIIDLSMQYDDADLDMYVHYTGIDVALRRGTLLDFIPASMREHRRRTGVPYGAPGWTDDLRELRRLGADGRITEAAAAILACEHLDREAVLSALSANYECRLAIPTAKSPMYVTFFWHNGVLRAEVSMNQAISWHRDQLELFGMTFPETALSVLPGRPISDIADLPFGGDLVIDNAEAADWGIRLRVEERELLINLKSGKVWKDPSRSPS